MKSLPVNQQIMGMAKKEKPPKWRAGNTCVLYTRVSDDSQFDNTSLTTQKKDMIAYAERKGLEVRGLYGGIVDSAKTDERKEFQKMLAIVRKDKSISTVLVYSYERFSRSQYAADLSRSLAELGIKILSVIQEVDVTSPAGKLQQNIFFAFGYYDNELRREKTVRGMQEQLLNGYWVAATPFGYTNLKRKEKAHNHEYVINEQGELLRLGFKWKAEGKLSNLEIVQKLRKMGSKIAYKSFVRIISNPFYCGYISFSLIPGKVIKGHHPALVSQELFMRANDIVMGNPHIGIAKKYKKPELPLKSFMRSDDANEPFTGYIKKGIYYYKTRGMLSAINVRADVLNNLFQQELKKFTIDEKYLPVIQEKVKEIVLAKFEEQIKEQSHKKKLITELLKKMEDLEIRFIERDLTKDLFDKYTLQYKKELEQLKAEIASNDFESSNLEKAVAKGIQLSLKPLQLWDDSDYDDKQRLQYLIFPEGIRYNKQKKEIRTPRVNSIFSLIARVASITADHKKSHLVKNGSYSHLVVPPRIELGSRV